MDTKVNSVPLLDDTCDTCERRDSLGFHNEATARQVTSQLARGQAHPYCLVELRGRWYFVKAALVNLKLGTSFASSLTRNKAIRDTIQYLGGTIVAAYNTLGDEVEP